MISSYLQDLSASIGLSGSTATASGEKDVRHVTLVELDAVRRPTPMTFINIGYVDGYDVVRIECNGQTNKIASQHSSDAVSSMRILPSPSGHPRNLSVTFKSSSSVVRFVNLTSNESYHLIRMTSPVLSVHASLAGIAIAVEGRIHIFNPESLEETFTVQTMVGVGGGGAACALSDRWLAYNMNPQQAGLGSPRGALLGQVWNKLSSIGQDAFDNIVIAVSNHPTIAQTNKDGTATAEDIVGAPTMSALQSPVKLNRDSRNGIIAIRDVVSMKVIGCIEERLNSGRSIECLQWSNCGTQLLATSGNGHSVLIYSVSVRGDSTAGPGGNQLEFRQTHSLNRGITPAVITGLGINSAGSLAAICSAKGTVHLFQLSGKDEVPVGRVKPAAGGMGESGMDPEFIFDESGSLLVLNKFTLAVHKYAVSDPHTPVLLDTYSLVRSASTDEPNVQLDMDNTTSDQPTTCTESSVEIKTCGELPVPLWMCPHLTFWRSTGEQLEFTLNHGVKVEASRPIDPVLLTKEVNAALATPLVGSRQVPSVHSTDDKYFVSSRDSTRDGFVQIVPMGSANSPRSIP